jgi:hypothetical protein
MPVVPRLVSSCYQSQILRYLFPIPSYPDRFGDFTGNRLFLIEVRAKRPDMAYHKAYRMREGWEPDTSSSVAYTDKGVPDEG